MITVADRIRRSFLVSAVSLSIISLVASCTFGLTPATLNRSSATVSIAFPSGTQPSTASPSPQVGSGDSRAVAPGANWLYLRAGEGDGSFETYGPYEIGSGTFTTKDIPAGTYDYLAILLVSESIPAKTELSVDGKTVTFAGALSLPDERFFALLSNGTLSAFFDGRFCVASGYVVKPCKIVSGKNVISATLVPLTVRTATMIADPSSALFSCPTNDSGSLRPVYFKVGALAYPEGSASPSVMVTICPAKTASWARVGSVLLYDEAGTRLGALDVNGMLTVDKDKPEAAVRTVTVGNPTRGALYVYVSYEHVLGISLQSSVEEAGTYVSSKGTAGATGTRTDPQSLAYAVNNSGSSTILLLDNVETNVTLSVARPLTVRPALGVTAPRIKATSGFTGSYISVASGGNLTLQGVFIEGLTGASGSPLDIAGGSATLTGGTVISGSKGVPAPGGGAAFVHSGSLVLDGATIENCSSVRGGGVYVTSTGTLVIKGSSLIRECAALELGGGVYSENGGKVDISAASSSSITSNRAVLGGGGVLVGNGVTFSEGTGGWASRVADNNAYYPVPNVAYYISVGTDSDLMNALNDSSKPRVIDVYQNIGHDASIDGSLMVAGECSLVSTNNLTVSRLDGFSSEAFLIIPSGASLSVGGSLSVSGLKTGGDSMCSLVSVVGGKFSLRDEAKLVGNQNEAGVTDRIHLGGAVNVCSGGQFTMYGGFVGGSSADLNASYNGGNVYVYGGTFTLLGGTVHDGIANNSGANSGCGGGVYIDGTSGSSSFIMPAGSTGLICTNTAYNYGGGVFLTGSLASAILEGGTIGSITPGEGNTATTYDGGGLYLSNQAQATLSGTVITNNIAESQGGGIFISGNCQLTIDPNLSQPLVKANTATNGWGGGLYLASNSCCTASGFLKDIVTDGNHAVLTTYDEWYMAP